MSLPPIGQCEKLVQEIKAMLAQFDASTLPMDRVVEHVVYPASATERNLGAGTVRSIFAIAVTSPVHGHSDGRPYVWMTHKKELIISLQPPRSYQTYANNSLVLKLAKDSEIKSLHMTMVRRLFLQVLLLVTPATSVKVRNDAYAEIKTLDFKAKLESRYTR